MCFVVVPKSILGRLWISQVDLHICCVSRNFVTSRWNFPCVDFNFFLSNLPFKRKTSIPRRRTRFFLSPFFNPPRVSFSFFAHNFLNIIHFCHALVIIYLLSPISIDAEVKFSLLTAIGLQVKELTRRTVCVDGDISFAKAVERYFKVKLLEVLSCLQMWVRDFG